MISLTWDWLSRIDTLTCALVSPRRSLDAPDLHGKEKVNGSIPFGGSHTEQGKRPDQDILGPGVSDRQDFFAMNSR
jgi:hypothetical protein